jgi:pimeloyl-ACP methyl ester carboxylesterase
MTRLATGILVLAFAALDAGAQDYARERRMEAEIVPALMVGEAVRLRTANGREFLGIYAHAPSARAAIVLVHGRNVHPDHELIGALRMKLNEMGYTTLGIQMPVLAAERQANEDFYPRLFPEAAGRIAAAGTWLQAKGEKRLVLLSHSMGSWMSSEYFEHDPAAPYLAWVSLGTLVRYGPAAKRRPLLDVYGDADLPAVLEGVHARAKVATRQVVIPNAGHMYTGRESAVADVVAAWLAEVLR